MKHFLVILLVSAATMGSGGSAAAPVAGVASTASVAATQGGLYVALGDSIAAGWGASSVSRGYVQLYYGYLQSSPSGVTDLLNLSHESATTTDLRNRQLGSALSAINESSDTKAVTIDIGSNDTILDPNCPTANAPTCPLAANLRAILAALNAALAEDPGSETVQLMEYYDRFLGLPAESTYRQLLLGSDGKVDCSASGDALGVNDLIHCIGLEQGATLVDVLPVFDAAGLAFLAPDRSHPNDAGHLAIATAFGGAATPVVLPPPPPPPPPSASCTVPKVTGKQLKSAKRLIKRAHCSLGRVSYRYAAARKGTVLTQRPRPGLKLASGTVSITVSRGRKGR